MGEVGVGGSKGMQVDVGRVRWRFKGVAGEENGSGFGCEEDLCEVFLRYLRSGH